MSQITYNDQTTEIPAGKYAVLPCENEIMKSDVVVVADSFIVLSYDGKHTPIEEGKTATLPCSGKVMKDYVILDAQFCRITVYSVDDTTILADFTIAPDVTVSVKQVSDTAMRLTFTDPGGGTHVENLAYSAWLDGVSESNYYNVRYTDGDSFVLSGHKTHRISLRPHRLGYTYPENIILFFGLNYVDGLPARGNVSGTSLTWGEWVDYVAGSLGALNTIGAKIVDGYVYTSDEKKVLYTSSGRRVLSTDLVGGNYEEYTFSEVST